MVKVFARDKHLGGVPLYLEASCQKDLFELTTFIYDLHDALPDLGLIVIDDIQGMVEQGEYEANGPEISETLKEIAGDTKLCIMAATNISLQSQYRRDKRPVLRDLRTDGKLDLYADVVCALYREDYYKPDAPRGCSELILLKNTKGLCGTIGLILD